MDDVISTIFLSKINKNIILIRVPSINEKWNLKNKIVYDIGLRRICSPSKKQKWTESKWNLLFINRIIMEKIWKKIFK